MTIDGLWKHGYYEMADEIADNHYNSVLKVWKDTGTFWEYYAPEKIEPGFMARKNFVGWTGLPPIAVFIEYILGIKSDYSENRIDWNIRQLEEHGIDRYPFGPDGTVSLTVKKRASADEKPVILVKTDKPFELVVRWGGEVRTVNVEKSGTITLK